MLALRQVRAILADSLRESRERRALYVLLALASLLVLLSFSVSFRGGDPAAALARQANALPEVTIHGVDMHVQETVAASLTVGAVRAATAEDWGGAGEGGHAVELAFASQAQLDAIIDQHRRLARRRLAGDGGDRAAPVLGAEERADYLRERFLGQGWQQAAVRWQPGEGLRCVLAVRADYPFEVEGAHELSLGFGALTLPQSGLSLAQVVVMTQLGLANTFAGWLGMLVAVVVTAGFVPSLLQKGTLDLALARPIGRARLLLAKYLGGLWFVFLLAVYLVVGTGLGLTLRTGYSNPWYLACIVTVTAQFAVLYSVSVLVAVLWRSSGLASLLTLGVWGISSAVVGARALLMGLGEDEAPGWLTRALDVAYAVLPKIKDLDALNALFLSQSWLSPKVQKRTFGDTLEGIDWAWSLGTTAAFTAAMLGLAVWAFRRRDC